VKIGIDIGRVIIGGNGEDTFFTEDFLETPEVPGAFEAIFELPKAGHEIHLISKCGEAVENKSLIWLNYYGFLYAAVPRHRVHFVRKRHLKVFMAQALELDIFIDDRQDIIESMQKVITHPILFTSWEQTNAELREIFDIVPEG